MELIFEFLKMQKWNKPTDRSEIVDEKYGVICLVIMFTSKVMVIIMYQLAHFFVFYACDNKKLVTVRAKYLGAFERYYWLLSENGMVSRLWNYCLWDIEGRKIRKTAESAKNTKILYFQGLMSS